MDRRVVQLLEGSDEDENTIAFTPAAIQPEPAAGEDEEYPDFADVGTSPPILDLLSNGTLHEFLGTNSENPDSFSVQCKSRLNEYWQLEFDMTVWYDRYFFKEEKYLRKNWEPIHKGGYFAAFIPKRSRWVRAFVGDIVYADDYEEYSAGLFECQIMLLDFGLQELIPRRYLLPLREKYLQLPSIGFLASFHFIDDLREHEFSGEIIQAFKEDTENQQFQALVVEQSLNENIPLQALKLVILEYFKDLGCKRSLVYTVRGYLNCGYKAS